MFWWWTWVGGYGWNALYTDKKTQGLVQCIKIAMHLDAWPIMLRTRRDKTIGSHNLVNHLSYNQWEANGWQGEITTIACML